MAKVSQVKDYMSLEEIRVRIRTPKDPDQQMRWQIIYTVAADPRVATIVATQLGGSKWLVSSAVAQYNRFGQKAFCGPGRGRHRSRFHRSYNQVFDYIKENDFRNRVFDSLDDVENQLSRSVNTLQEDKHRLKSMTSYPHLHGNLA